MDVRKLTLDNLLVSKVRIKVLEFFLTNPKEAIHLRGAVRLFEEEINAVRREFERLEEANLISSEMSGNKKFFRLNPNHDFVNELTKMFVKTYGLGGDILNNLGKLGDVQFAALTPAYYSLKSDQINLIDFLIVGDINMDTLQNIITKAERKIGREIHYTVMKTDEFMLRKRRQDQFLVDLLVEDNVLLVGDTRSFLG